jgi:hypothetical protein
MTELAARMVTASATMLLAPELSDTVLASWVMPCNADAVVDGTLAGAKPMKVATGGPGTEVPATALPLALTRAALKVTLPSLF